MFFFANTEILRVRGPENGISYRTDYPGNQDELDIKFWYAI